MNKKKKTQKLGPIESLGIAHRPEWDPLFSVDDRSFRRCRGRSASPCGRRSDRGLEVSCLGGPDSRIIVRRDARLDAGVAGHVQSPDSLVVEYSYKGTIYPEIPFEANSTSIVAPVPILFNRKGTPIAGVVRVTVVNSAGARARVVAPV